ncbi:facilitated trehalose transporter Tret1-like isoform X2 [Planococcus citri]
MVAEKVSISQQVLVSQSDLSKARHGTQYIGAIIATFGALIIGTTLGWTSPTTDALEGGQYGFSVSKDEMAWIGSFMPLGAIVGSLIVGSLVDLLGRKNLIIVLNIPITIGWIVMAFAPSVFMFIVGRFLTGISSGAFCFVVPMYTAEIAGKDIRGALGTYFQLQITVGILLVYIAGTFVNVFTLTLICAVIPVIYALMMLLLPETPYFHIMKKNLSAAKESMSWYRGSKYDSQPELLEIQNDIERDEAEKVPFLQAFQTKAAKRGLLIGIGAMFFQQFSGCNAVIFYTKSIFQDAGATIDPNLSSIIIGVVQTLSTYIASLIVDKLGRRLLMLMSIIVMTLCTFTLGLYFYLKTDAKLDVSDIGWLPLLSLSGYIIVFSLGFGPVPWILVGEIFPLKIKGAACSIVCLCNWSYVFLVTKLFPLFVIWFGAGITFWCFAVCSAIGVFFVALIVPETKGKTLSEVQAMLGDENIVPSTQYEVNPPFGETKVKV